jgi:hypothetical protein
MLTIRTEQMRALEQIAARDFTDRLTAHLRSQFPLSDPQRLTELAVAGMEIADQHGIKTESGAARLITLLAEFCPDIAEKGLPRQARNALLRYRATEKEKLDRFEVALKAARRQPQSKG